MNGYAKDGADQHLPYDDPPDVSGPATPDGGAAEC